MTHSIRGDDADPADADTGAGAGADSWFESGAVASPYDEPTDQFVAVTRRATSTANTPTPGVGRHAAAHVAGDERGSLVVEDVVVEKVAVAAAGEIDGVGGIARRVLGVPTGSDHSSEAAQRRPRASARVAGRTVALEVRLSVAYPASVRATTEAVRAHVRDRVAALTELHVTRVDITVAALTRTTTPTGRTIQ